MSSETWQAWAVLALSVAVALVVVDVIRRLLTRRLARRLPTMAAELRPCGPAAYTTAALVAVRSNLVRHLLPDATHTIVTRLVSLVLVAAVTWLIIEIVHAASDIYLSRLIRAHEEGSPKAQRTRTQLTMIRRAAGAIFVVIGVGAMLFTFPSVRALGAGVMASAGVIGIVVGIAAQSTLGNLFAGLQLAFSDAVRIGDVVVVEDEYGVIEELTLTYVVVRIWDERRLVMPVSYFTATPFENWTKNEHQLLGTVYLRVDWFVPVSELRAATRKWLAEHEEWDGRDWSMVVTDVLDNGLVELRVTVSATDPSALWRLRCDLREWLVGRIRTDYPYALPRFRGVVSPSTTDTDRTSPD